MRQAVPALIISGVLLTAAAACGTATNPAPGEAGVGIGSATAPPAAARSAEAAIRSSCEALGQAYGKNMAPFAESLTKLADARKQAGDDKEPRRRVQQSLQTFAIAIRNATQNSLDAKLRSDGKQTADRLQAKATEADLFKEIKTPEDVNKALGSTLKEWLAPVDQHCS